VSYVEQGDTLLIPGEGAWKKNLEQGSPVRVRLRGSERSASPEVIKEIGEVERLVEFMMAANPAVSRFIGVPREVDGRPNRARLEQAVRGGFAVVRLRLDSERQP
jgi:hypothetical protein